jgi:hypothetical protein
MLAEDPDKDCESEARIEEAIESIAAVFYYRHYFFDSDNYDLGKANNIIKVMYKPLK